MAETYVDILSLRFPCLGRGALLARAHRLAARHAPASIFTPNAEMACRAAGSAAFRDMLNRADLLIPDGIGISLAAARQGVRLPRVPGIEFAQDLLCTAPERGYRLFLLGARPGVGAAAGKELVRRYPRITLCGVQDGYYPASMGHMVAAAIRAARPDILFVCLGSPRQEAWIATHRIPCLALGLGGALDVWAGVSRRAPEAVRRLGCEWLWRTVREPQRMSRLPALASFTLRAVVAKPSQR